MNEAQVDIFDLVVGCCDVRNCRHNVDGVCSLYPLDEETVMRSDVYKSLISWLCNSLPNGKCIECRMAEIDDDLCELCGEQLEQRTEYRGEFWGSPSYETIWVCPNCG